MADPIQGFHDLTIVAHNVRELRAFYAALGFTQVVDRGDELVVFRVGSNELALHTSSERPTNALVLSLLVSDFEPILHAANQLGLRVQPPAQLRPGLIGIALHDPNGNKLEFLMPGKP